MGRKTTTAAIQEGFASGGQPRSRAGEEEGSEAGRQHRGLTRFGVSRLRIDRAVMWNRRHEIQNPAVSRWLQG